jgi:restriction endonuclease S subunit
MAEISIVPFEKIECVARWDAEYYQPKNQALERDLLSASPIPISSFAYVTDGIHASPEWVDNGGITYLSAKCVKDNVFDLTNAGQISKAQNATNHRTQARLNDVLVTTVGTIGNAAVVTDEFLPANMDRHLGIIRLNDKSGIDPYYLATFLNCIFGRFQTERESTGNVQLNLFIDKIKKLLVPVSRHFNEIGALTRTAYKKIHDAQRLYPEAEAELLARMGWDKLLKKSSELFYTTEFIEAQKQRRFDAEYFQPKYKRLRLHLHKVGAMQLSDFCSIPNRGVQPVYVENGEILVINSRHLGPTNIDIADTERTSLEFYSLQDTAKAILKQYDVLVYSTGAYVGRTNVYLDKKEGIASNHVTIIRPQESVCNPVYLALFLNSRLGIMQSEQFASGSAQRELYPNDLMQFLIYLPKNEKGAIDLVWQKELADKVIQASKAKVEAQAILESAKKAVEDSINSSMY